MELVFPLLSNQDPILAAEMNWNGIDNK